MLLQSVEPGPLLPYSGVCFVNVRLVRVAGRVPGPYRAGRGFLKACTVVGLSGEFIRTRGASGGGDCYMWFHQLI